MLHLVGDCYTKLGLVTENAVPSSHPERLLLS